MLDTEINVFSVVNEGWALTLCLPMTEPIDLISDQNGQENYRQALWLANQNKTDIILCDYRLQVNITGVEVMEMMRRELQTQFPAIIIIGDTDPELLKLKKSMGFMILAKPVQPLTLQEKVGHLFEKAENRINAQYDNLNIPIRKRWIVRLYL